MRALLIDNKIREDIQEMVTYAENNYYSIDDLLDMMNGYGRPTAGEDKNLTVFIPVGVKVVYSIEEQGMGLTRHLSVSVDAENKLPAVELVKTIMDLIGFENRIEDCHTYEEEYALNRKAINILELIES